MMRFLPITFTLLLLCGMFAQGLSRPDAADVDGYHLGVRYAVEQIPLTIGAWRGTEVEPPEAAVQLLRPNVLFSCRYLDPVNGRAATFTLVQCRDSRDMAGHYPPVCYPAHGWEETTPMTVKTIRVGGVGVPVARYEYRRSGFAHEQRIVVYGLFVLPGRGFATGMDAVRDAASDFEFRGFGAAQVQVIMDSWLGSAMEETVVRELIEPTLPTLRVIEGTKGGESRG